MLLWYAVHRDKPHEAPHTEEPAPHAAVLKRFDDAAQLGMHDGRAVIGMWLIDGSTERGDVVRVFGIVPPRIRGQYEVYLARSTAKD
jgi:hypothetical protein